MRTYNYCDEILLVLHLSILILVVIVSSIMINCYSATAMLTTCRVGRGVDYSCFFHKVVKEYNSQPPTVLFIHCKCTGVPVS